MDIDKIIRKIDEQQNTVSEMYFDCMKQQQGFQFWIWIDLDDPDFKVRESAMLTMSTIPNPANWYPQTSHIIIDTIRSDGLDHLDDEQTEYYNENPDEYLDDVWDDYLEEYKRELKEEIENGFS